MPPRHAEARKSLQFISACQSPRRNSIGELFLAGWVTEAGASKEAALCSQIPPTLRVSFISGRARINEIRNDVGSRQLLLVSVARPPADVLFRCRTEPERTKMLKGGACRGRRKRARQMEAFPSPGAQQVAHYNPAPPAVRGANHRAPAWQGDVSRSRYVMVCEALRRRRCRSGIRPSGGRTAFGSWTTRENIHCWLD